MTHPLKGIKQSQEHIEKRMESLRSGGYNSKWQGGVSSYPEYMNYRNMIRRGRLTYGNYTDVSVCERWQESFWYFLEDMGSKPTDGRWTVDRIDTFGNYEPSNCRWATASEQLRNRRPYHQSESTREKIRIVRTGTTLSEEIKRKISISLLNTYRERAS